MTLLLIILVLLIFGVPRFYAGGPVGGYDAISLLLVILLILAIVQLV